MKTTKQMTELFLLKRAKALDDGDAQKVIEIEDKYNEYLETRIRVAFMEGYKRCMNDMDARLKDLEDSLKDSART